GLPGTGRVPARHGESEVEISRDERYRGIFTTETRRHREELSNQVSSPCLGASVVMIAGMSGVPRRKTQHETRSRARARCLRQQRFVSETPSGLPAATLIHAYARINPAAFEIPHAKRCRLRFR